MSPGPQTVFLRDPNVQWNRLGEELVLLDGSGRMLRGLNGTGARVWELLEPGRDASQVAAQLARECGAPSERVLADVLAFLSELNRRSLVAPSPAPPLGEETR